MVSLKCFGHFMASFNKSIVCNCMGLDYRNGEFSSEIEGKFGVKSCVTIEENLNNILTVIT